MEKYDADSEDYRGASVHQLLNLSGKTVAITGGVRGLGLAFARGCAEIGGNIAVLDLPESLSPGLSLIESDTGARVKYYCVDVSNYTALKNVFESVKSDFGSIDCLVNAAGIGIGGPLVDYDRESIQKILDVNVVGTISSCQFAVQQMLAQGTGGSIVNIASIGGHGAIPGQANSIYCASKGAILSFTKSLAVELAEKGIRVNSISPGFFLTSMTPGYLAGDLPRLEYFRASIPVKRFADRAELKSMVAFLLSPASSYVTGEDIIVDGGVMA